MVKCTMPTPTPPSGIVTFLFADLEGHTRLWEQYPHAMPQVFAHYQALVQGTILQQHGHSFQTVGDVYYAAFAVAADALGAAAAIQQGMHAADWGEVGAMKARVALHTGAAEWQGDHYYAHYTLNRLSRIQQAGHGGQILLSAATSEQISGPLPVGLSLRDLGERQLRDLASREHLYQVLVADLPQEFPPLRTIDRRTSLLLAQPNPFIGRQRELQAIGGLLRGEDVRLVTLLGPGGTGKTRLASAVAEGLLDEFADGVFFVPLAAISEPRLVVDAIAVALGVGERSGKTMMDTLKILLATRQMLVVLDNCEQVVAAAPLVAELLAAAPGLKILATSRQPLGLANERRYEVPPLQLPAPQSLLTVEQLQGYEAVALFVQRAEAAQRGFQLTPDNAAVVAAICIRLDGLPLAIELAAAQVRAFSPVTLLARLNDQLLTLKAGERDRPSRHQTLMQAIDWGYNLLDATAQRLFRRLAVFVAGADEAAVTAICLADEPSGNSRLAGLAELVDKSLLRLEPGVADEPRYQMLATIREYALLRLEESGEGADLMAQYTGYFLSLAEQAEPEIRGAHQSEWLARLAQEHDNLRHALAWGLEHQLATALKLAASLWRFWEIRGYFSEGRAALTVALNRNPHAAPADRAKAMNGAGNLAILQGDYPAARNFYEQALDLRRQLADQRGIAAALNNLGNVASAQADYAAARTFYEESLKIKRQLGDKPLIASTLYNLGVVAHTQCDYPAAHSLYAESLAIRQEIGDERGSAVVTRSLGEVALHQGDYALAQTRYQESLAICQRLGDRSGTAEALDGLGIVAYCQADNPQAVRFYTEAQIISRELGYGIQEAYSYLHLGNVARVMGDFAKATSLLKQGLSLFWKIGHQPGVVDGLISLGIVLGNGESEGEAGRAVRLLSSGPALRPIINWLATERAAFDLALERGRVRLSPFAFELAQREGVAMSIEQAVAYALAEDEADYLASVTSTPAALHRSRS